MSDGNEDPTLTPQNVSPMQSLPQDLPVTTIFQLTILLHPEVQGNKKATA